MIQINPLKSYIDGGVRAALTTPPSASLVFDLPGKAIWVKGVKLKGIDHTYTFNHDNYITLTNTPDKNNPESEDIKIGVNITTLKNVIDTTYNGGTLALLQEGLNTEERTWLAKILHNYINNVLPTTKNLKINGTNYAIYTTENSLPLFFAPVSLGTTGQILACTSSGLSWINLIQNTDYRVSLSSATNDNDYRIILKQGANNNPETDFVRFSEYLTFNPYTKTLKINNIKVVTATDIYTGSTAGLVPAATSAQLNYYLRGDGTWVNIATEMAAANTWRPIKVGNTDALGSSANTGTLSFIAGTGITLAWDATNKRIIITNSSPDINHNTDETVRQVPKTDNVNRPLMMINGSTSAGEQINTSMFSTGIYANASTKMITANGFIKAGSSDSYVLLGGGGHKVVSDFATSGHNHDGRYIYNYGSTQMDGASKNKNALGMTTNSGITGDWWHILQAAWNDEYRWNSQIAFPTLNRNGIYYRSGLDDNTAWGAWVKLLDVNNYSSILDSRYYTESEINTKLGAYLPLTGGTMTGPITFEYGDSTNVSYSTTLDQLIRYNNMIHLNIRNNKIVISKMGTNGLILDISNVTATKTLKFLNADGTIALLSDTVGYIGTTLVLKLSVNLALTGITSITGPAGAISFGGNFHLDSTGTWAMFLNYYTDKNIIMVAGSSQGNVGIGTTSPAEKLDVVGNIKANSIYPRTNFTYNLGTSSSEYNSTYTRGIFARHLDSSAVFKGDYALYIGYGNGSPTNATYFYYSSGTSSITRILYATLNNNGLYTHTRFGVNGLSTSYNFYVNGTSYFSDHILANLNISLTGNSANIGFNRNVTNGAIYTSNSAAYLFHTDYSTFNLLAYNGSYNNSYVFHYNSSTGRVGILKNSPSYNLDVNGSIGGTGIVLSGTTPITFYGVGSGTYNLSCIYCNSNGITLETPRTTNDGSATILPFLIRTRGGLGAIINAGGFVHNSKNDNNYVLLAGGSYKAISDFKIGNYVKISGDTMTGDLIATGVKGAGTSNRLIFRHLDGLNCSGDYCLYLLYHQTGSAVYFHGTTYRIVSGNTYFANYYTISDARKKQNIHKISDNIKLFEWKETGETSYGFVAQDLEVNHPELVNDNGNIKTVNYNAALSLVIAKLENRVKELEAKLGIESSSYI